MSVEIQRLAQTITCHAFNADRSRVALCPNNNEIHIYGRDGNSWALESVLKEHDQTVLGLDWAPNTNRIVSCSQDRNAYVWTHVDAEARWKPSLVILRINRAATDVKWSPEENKFAVASGAKLVSICAFEEEHDWWVSKHIKKHRSTVLSVAWHPNNLFIATGSTDFKARIFSAYIRGVDSKKESEVFSGKAVGTFGELLAEFDQVQGWVHAVSWSPNGQQLVFTGHDSRIAFADVTKDPPAVQTIKLPGLPFTCLMFASDNTVVAGGHECNPQLFVKQGTWKPGARLDKAEVATTAASGDARTRFQSMERTGKESNVVTLATKHQNSIKKITPYQGSPANWTQVATSGIDGNLVVWAVKA